MEMIEHCHPHCHSHEMALMDHVKRSIAASYTSLLSRIDSHIEDSRPHISAEEKDYWDNKADKDQIRELELKLSDKADFCDILEVKETLALIKAKMKSKCEEQNNFLTAEDIDLYLDDIKRRLSNLENKDVQSLLSPYLKTVDLDYEIARLNKYATKEWVLSQLGNNNNEGSKVSYSPQITESTPNSYAIGTLYIDNHPYNIRGVDTYGTSTGGGNNSTTVSYSGNSSVENLTEEQGKYTIGTITINGTPYTIYGKDNVSGGTTVIEPENQGLVNAIQYTIQPISSTVHLDKTTNNVTGTLKWKVYRTETKDNKLEYVGSSNQYGITTNAILSGETIQHTTEQGGNVYVCEINKSAQNISYFILIFVYKDGNMITSAIVPINIPGDNGNDGQNPVQALTYEVIRMRPWVDSPNPPYNNGTVAENGVKYLDVVKHDTYSLTGASDGAYYKCKISGTTSEPGTNNNAWEVFSVYGSGYFDTLIAHSAYIQSLTAKQIVVTDNDSKPVAGMLNGSFIPTELTDNGVQNNNSNGIRIFAGKIPNNGNVADAAFTVDENGTVKASGGKVKFNSDGSGYLANNAITWNANGECTINGTLHYNRAVGNVVNMTGDGIISDDAYFVIPAGQNYNYITLELPLNPINGQTLFIDCNYQQFKLKANKQIRYFYKNVVSDPDSGGYTSIEQGTYAANSNDGIDAFNAGWSGAIEFIYTGSYWQQLVHNINIS